MARNLTILSFRDPRESRGDPRGQDRGYPPRAYGRPEDARDPRSMGPGAGTGAAGAYPPQGVNPRIPPQQPQAYAQRPAPSLPHPSQVPQGIPSLSQSQMQMPIPQGLFSSTLPQLMIPSIPFSHRICTLRNDGAELPRPIGQSSRCSLWNAPGTRRLESRRADSWTNRRSWILWFQRRRPKRSG